MLQPLIKRLLQPVFNPRSRTGLLMDRGCVWIAATDSGSEGTPLVTNRRIVLSHNPFADDSGENGITAAGAAIVEFLRDADDGRYNSIRMALPDPAVSFCVFELDAMPKTGRERNELVRWLFKKELYLDADNLACISQDLGADGGKRLLLGVAVNNTLINGIIHVLNAAGIFPVSMEVSSISIFNALLETRDANSGGAALVTLETDFWSLLLWDENRYPRFMRGYWRDKTGNAGSDAELRAIASEIERLITSYVRASSERRVGKIYIAGGDAGISGFTGLLNERLSEAAEYVDFAGRYRDAAPDLPACCYALCGDV